LGQNAAITAARVVRLGGAGAVPVVTWISRSRSLRGKGI
ncbi:unnamed protein product, partial [Ixodes hexagonus]